VWLQDLATAPELAEFRDRFHIRTIRRTIGPSICAASIGQGHPNIYLQLAHGKSAPPDDYDGPANLAKALPPRRLGLRREQDPDLRSSPFDVHSIPTAAWLLLGGRTHSPPHQERLTMSARSDSIALLRRLYDPRLVAGHKGFGRSVIPAPDIKPSPAGPPGPCD